MRALPVGSRRLVYALRFGETKRLSISVQADLTVAVTAPHGVDPVEVDRRVGRRTAWLHRQLREFEQYHPLPVPRRYVSGETHLYLGRQYRLRVRKGPADVTLSGRFLLVRASGKRTVRDAVEDWYRVRAREVFARRLGSVLKAAPWLNGAGTAVRVRSMSRRWGSCSPSGVITLNVELVKAPPSCIDYILAHEIAHRHEMSHSKRFYALLERVVPDWRRARERLNRVVR
ncbi:MAG TPA: SprT family zinc-dependent metalloprotease [Gemmatimonadales bacterium]